MSAPALVTHFSDAQLALTVLPSSLPGMVEQLSFRHCTAASILGAWAPLHGAVVGAGEHSGNLGLVLSQDSELLPVVQKGMRSRGFRHQLWGEQEQRLRHFHAELERYLAGRK